MKHWSSTQASTALSSAEAEFVGVVRGSGQGLGFQALLRDLGVDVPLRVWTDSSAAIGICQRQGLGKLRHLDTQMLWVQQAVRTSKVDLRKIDGEKNPADLLTKHSLTQERLHMLVHLHGCKYIGGRAESAPKVRKGQSTKTTMADADVGVNAVEDANDQPPRPVMPHLKYQADELDEMHPPLEVPEEELLDSSLEREAERRDSALQHGLRSAQKINDDMTQVGGTRHTMSLHDSARSSDVKATGSAGSKTRACADVNGLFNKRTGQHTRNGTASSVDAGMLPLGQSGTSDRRGGSEGFLQTNRVTLADTTHDQSDQGRWERP